MVDVKTEFLEMTVDLLSFIPMYAAMAADCKVDRPLTTTLLITVAENRQLGSALISWISDRQTDKQTDVQTDR